MSKNTFDQAVEAHHAGNTARARDLFLRCLDEQGDDPVTLNNLGMLEATQGHYPEARAWFQRALRLEPLSLDALTNLVQACVAMNEPERAESHLRETLSSGGLSHELRRELLSRCERFAAGALERRQWEAAWRLSRLAAHAIEPTPGAIDLLSHCIRNIDPRSVPGEVREDLLLCLAADHIDHRQLAGIAARSLELSYRWIRQLPEDDLLATLDGTGLSHDPLLLALLERSIVNDPVLEHLLENTRAALLDAWSQNTGPSVDHQPLLRALALQCFANEYLWWIGDQEKGSLTRLSAELDRSSREWDGARLRALCLYACYAPLHTRCDAPALAEALQEDGAAWLLPLRQRMLEEPATEQSLAQGLEGRAPSDAVSLAVREQYETSPYPRWLTQASHVENSVADLLGAIFPGLQPPAFLARPMDILIAGCGTGEHAIRVARRHPQCRVTGIDLSRASLAYAARKAREMEVHNLHLRQDDILHLPPDPRYQMVECVGVLHHMDDPADGLAVLARLLEPGGVIKLGLYARAARDGVRAARDRIKALALEPTGEGMRQLRRRVLLGQEPSLRSLIRSPDFYTLSSVRDLLFHVQEHQFDLSQLGALVTGAGLMLIGFHAPANVREPYLARHPDDPWLQDLERLRQFERQHPGAFAGMYQLWCFKPPG